VVHPDGDLREDGAEDLLWVDFFAEDDNAENFVTVRGQGIDVKLSAEEVSQLLIPEPDLLYGTSTNDPLDGASDNDMNHVYGFGGNDLLNAHVRDTLIGGAGDDTLNANARQENGNNLLLGGEGNDVIVLGYDSTAYGDEGDDTFLQAEGSRGGNFLEGGEGRDRFQIAASAAIDPIFDPIYILDFNPQEDIFVVERFGGAVNELQVIADNDNSNVNISYQGNIVATLAPAEGFMQKDLEGFFQIQGSDAILQNQLTTTTNFVNAM